MEGIHILNTTVVMEMVSWYVPAIIACGILLVVCCVISFEIYNHLVSTITIILGGVFAILAMVIACWAPKVETDRNRYEVTIDESVSLTDVYEKYDVIEQRGKIWILEDKEINE
jgi:hypothetical protein